MPRVLKELALLTCILLLAGGAVIGVTTVVGGQDTYDTFTGRVNKIPLQISSPTFGQVLSLPLTEGGQVQQGQPLARIQVIDRSFRVPQDSQLFKLDGDVLRILSPVNGLVAKMAIAPFSTVDAGQLILQLYTVDHTDLQVLMPQGRELEAYRSFYAAPGESKRRYRLRIEGTVPSESVSNVSPSTTVLRASCESAADCWSLLSRQQVTIYAQKGTVKSSFPALPPISWPPLPAGRTGP